MSDLRAAAERLRSIRNGSTVTNAYGGTPKPFVVNGEIISAFDDPSSLAQWHEDNEAIVAAYLAEHPADDDERITPEWLESVGFRVRNGRHEFHPIIMETFQFKNQPTTDWRAGVTCRTAVGQVTWLAVFFNRRDVRQFASSLGAPLLEGERAHLLADIKETPDGPAESEGTQAD